MPQKFVVIKHEKTGHLAPVAESTVSVWEKKGWKQLDAKASEEDLREAAELLGLEVAPDAPKKEVANAATSSTTTAPGAPQTGGSA